MALLLANARHPLRRSLAAAAAPASSLGAGLRQATADTSPRSLGLLHGRRLFCSDGSASFKKAPENAQPSGSEVASDLEIVYKRRLEEKRAELIESLVDAVDTCDPAQRDRVMEKYREVKHVSQEYHAVREKNHNSNKSSQRSETADGEKPMSFEKFLSITAWSVLLGAALSGLESRWR